MIRIETTTSTENPPGAIIIPGTTGVCCGRWDAKTGEFDIVVILLPGTEYIR